jgi:hypothetical protein
MHVFTQPAGEEPMGSNIFIWVLGCLAGALLFIIVVGSIKRR